MKRALTLLVLVSLATPLLAGTLQERIVNGLATVGDPSVVALTSNGFAFCTGTLVGCKTVLTAAHCVCASNGSQCGPGGADLDDPAGIQVFAQHAGLFPVARIAVPPTYAFAVAADVAVLELASPVAGIAPTPINTTVKPTPGTPGRITGFGITAGGAGDSGLKRTGKVITETCTTVPDGAHVCWSFDSPRGPAGEDSNTCSGDSGGPLFVTAAGHEVVAGVTSGGENGACVEPDDSFDADVFAYRTFVQTEGGADLANTACGGVPSAGSLGAPVAFGSGNLAPANPDDTWTFTVPPGSLRLVVTTNAAGSNDFDLYLKQGAPPTTSDFDCRGIRNGSFEGCSISSPASGTWYATITRFSGSGPYQLTATTFLDAIFISQFETGDPSEWTAAVP